MATISPAGTITLYHDVPFTNNYAHSIFFADRPAQASYFSGKQLGTPLTAQNYVKTENGKIRVEKNNNAIDDACYMSWQNGMVGSTAAHVFYAFILNIDLISANVVEITYEVDVLQTYLIGRTGSNGILGQCLIERRTPDSDEPGEHLEPEPIKVENFVYRDKATFLDGDITGWKILVYAAYSYSEGEKIVSQGFAAGLPQGVVCNVFNTYSDFKQWLDGMDVSANQNTFLQSILAVVAVPYAEADGGARLKSDLNPEHPVSCIKYQSNSTTIGESGNDYTPKYKKLLTYPFNCLHVSTGTQEKEYMYEFFNDSSMCNFSAFIVYQPNASSMLVPKNYKGKDYMYDESLSITYPQIPWGASTYNNWKVQNGIKEAIIQFGAIGKMMGKGSEFGSNDAFLNTGGVGGSTAGGLLGASVGMIGGTVGAISYDIYSRMRGIPSYTSSGTIEGMAVTKALNYIACRKCIIRQDAERLDDYFSRFGYATNRIQIPLKDGMVSTRNQLYIKTAGCIVKEGKCPAEFARRIEQIFNTGITWWKSDKVGKYN